MRPKNLSAKKSDRTPADREWSEYSLLAPNERRELDTYADGVFRGAMETLRALGFGDGYAKGGLAHDIPGPEPRSSVDGLRILFQDSGGRCWRMVLSDDRRFIVSEVPEADYQDELGDCWWDRCVQDAHRDYTFPRLIAPALRRVREDRGDKSDPIPESDPDPEQ